MQSLALISAYVAGINKESLDLKMFEKDRARRQLNRQQKQTAYDMQDAKYKVMMMGKSKKFTLERFSAIFDYFVSLEAEKSQENEKVLGHTIDYYATINSLCKEGLLKKTITKRGGASDGVFGVA